MKIFQVLGPTGSTFPGITLSCTMKVGPGFFSVYLSISLSSCFFFVRLLQTRLNVKKLCSTQCCGGMGLSSNRFEFLSNQTPLAMIIGRDLISLALGFSHRFFNVSSIVKPYQLPLTPVIESNFFHTLIVYKQDIARK